LSKFLIQEKEKGKQTIYIYIYIYMQERIKYKRTGKFQPWHIHRLNMSIHGYIINGDR